MTDNDFDTFKSELRNAPVIHFTRNSRGFQPKADAPAATLRTVKRDGRWIKVEG